MTTFSTLGLNDQLLKAIQELGFETPTEIQEKAIPIFLERKTDLVALAQTGTGKTASFGLPILHHIRVEERFTQALIISPTRELCLQITNDLKNYSKHLPGIKVVAVYGGSSINEQVKQLRQGAQIVVATPGRLIDLIDRKAVKLDSIETVVLDEADEMLNMGFQDDMETILACTPDSKITGLFSATMPKEIRQIANKYLKENVEVSAGKVNSASQSITHQYAVVHAKDKLAALKRIIDFNTDFFGIVFCTTKIETQEISDTLVKAGYNADCLHGDLSQQQRDKVMGKFRKRMVKILCATDVAARGIDVNNITHVIHYHLPDDIENYTHRSGRTARAGKKGISIALLHTREAYKLHQIEKLATIKFDRFMIPKGEEIVEQRVKSFVADFTTVDYEDEPTFHINEEWIQPLYQLDQATLISLIIHKELRSLDVDHNLHTDLNVTERGAGAQGKSGSSRFSNGNEVRIFINLGKKDNVRYDELRELIFKNTKVSGHQIKDIDMSGVYSFFNTDPESANMIMDRFKDVNFKGRSVRVERADGQPGGYSKKSTRNNDRSRDRSFSSRDNKGGSSRNYSSKKNSNSAPKNTSSKPKFESMSFEDMPW